MSQDSRIYRRLTATTGGARLALPMYQHLTDQQQHQDTQQEILSTITSKGQVTLPRAVRDQLGVTTHDRISFVIADDGTITLQAPRFPTIASLAGTAGILPQPLSWPKMRQIAREDALSAHKHAQRIQKSQRLKHTSRSRGGPSSTTT